MILNLTGLRCLDQVFSLALRYHQRTEAGPAPRLVVGTRYGLYQFVSHTIESSSTSNLRDIPS